MFWQHLFLVVFFLAGFGASMLGLIKSRAGHTNRETPLLSILGMFVWADAAVLGLFWMLVAAVSLFLCDWLLFWLIVAVFWVVRSLGEIVYWLNEQFSTLSRNPPQKFWLYRFFPNDSIWFVYQVFWQCVLVASIIVSVYLFSLWLPMR